MEHIADVTKKYGHKAGDLLVGNQMMAAKKIVAEASAQLIQGKKFGVKAQELLGKLATAHTETTKPDFEPAGSFMKDAESDISKSEKLVPMVKNVVAEMDKLRKYMHETTTKNTTDRVDQYMAVTSKQYMGVEEKNDEGQFVKMDSICAPKKAESVIRHSVATESDCAWMCDSALHPSKCAAFQYYPLYEEKMPSGMKKSGGSPTFDKCMTSDASPYKITPTKHRAYADFTYHGPFELTLKMEAGCDHIVFRDTGSGIMSVYKNNADSDTIVKGKSLENDKVMSFAELGEMTWSFPEQKSYSFYTYYGKNCAGTLEIKEKGGSSGAGGMGVCLLLPDVFEVSYYTCPADNEGEKSTPGNNAKCMLKVSENKGFTAGGLNYKKGPVKQDRCMVTERDSTTLDMSNMDPMDIDI